MPAQFRQKLQKLRYFDFHRHDRHESISFGLSDDELLAELSRIPAGDLFLGRYTPEEIEAALKRYGIMAKLARLGFSRPRIEIVTRDVYNHRLYVYTGQRDYDHILIELRLREGVFQPREHFIPGIELGPLRLILVDWLMLQNPAAEFDQQRPALPRQRHPGLGLLQNLIPLVMEVVRETGRAGVLDVPDHYHGALFYSRWFRFFNPEIEGRFLAMQRDLGSLPLHLVTHGVDQGCLINLATGKVDSWRPGEQILPLSGPLLDYFHHRQYMEKRDRAFQENRYQIDREKCEQRMREAEEYQNRIEVQGTENKRP